MYVDNINALTVTGVRQLKKWVELRCARICKLKQFNLSLDSRWLGDMFQKCEKRNHTCIAHNGGILR